MQTVTVLRYQDVHLWTMERHL